MAGHFPSRDMDPHSCESSSSDLPLSSSRSSQCARHMDEHPILDPSSHVMSPHKEGRYAVFGLQVCSTLSLCLCLRCRAALLVG